MLGPFKQAQLLSLAVAIVCAAAYVILYRHYKAGKNKNDQ